MNETKERTKNEEIAHLAAVLQKEGWQVDAIKLDPEGPGRARLKITATPLPSQR